MKQLLFCSDRILTIAVFLLVLSAPSLVHADPIPDYVLNKDYENCMGGDSAQSNPQRAHFCECSRNKMRQWDLDTYGATATEASQSSSGTRDLSQKIDEIASACLAESLK